MRPIYLWQYPTGPKFTWNDSDLITLLSEVRNLEGKTQWNFIFHLWSMIFHQKWLFISRLWSSESLKPIMGKVIVIEEGSVIFVLVWLISINKDSIPPYLHETVLEATLMKNQWTESLSAYNSLFRFSSRKYKFSL